MTVIGTNSFSSWSVAWFAVLGKIIAAGVFIAALATLMVRVGVLGMT